MQRPSRGDPFLKDPATGTRLRETMFTSRRKVCRQVVDMRRTRWLTVNIYRTRLTSLNLIFHPTVCVWTSLGSGNKTATSRVDGGMSSDGEVNDRIYPGHMPYLFLPVLCAILNNTKGIN